MASNSNSSRKFKKICVFCGSHSGHRKIFSDAAIDLGNELVKRKIDLVYGGGSVGLMGLIAHRVYDGGCHVLGLIPKALVPVEISGRGIGEVKIVADMHERKANMAEMAEAFIALPGGYGTLEELLEMITWAQLKIHNKPVGLLNVDGYYNYLLKLFDKFVEEGFVKPAARHILVSASSAKDLLTKMEVPLSVCRDLDRLMADFWWGEQSDGQKKIHWASWCKLARAKEEGGMGFKNLVAFNDALLVKQLWRIITKPNLLVSKVIKGKYFHKCNLWTVQAKHSDSWLWKSWLHAREFLLLGARYKVGDGSEISVWDAPWLPKVSGFKPQCIDMEARRNIKVVSQLFNQDGTGWNRSLVEQHFHPQDAELILKMHTYRAGTGDTLIWHYNQSGAFSVKIVYQTIMARHGYFRRQPESSLGLSLYKTVWKVTWQLKIKNKMKNFLWRCWHNCLATKDQLGHRRVEVDKICDLCGEEQENLDHILFFCDRAKMVWKLAGIHWENLVAHQVSFRE